MDDKDIIGLFISRDESAIGQVQEKYGRLLYRIAINILNIAEDAEECVQDTYISLWDSIVQVGPENLRAYAMKTARNHALKKRYYNYRENPADVNIDDLEEILTSHESAFEDVIALKDVLNGFLATLDPDARRIFLERYWMNESDADIARMLNISDTRVRAILHRCRKKLKEYLDRIETDN